MKTRIGKNLMAGLAAAGLLLGGNARAQIALQDGGIAPVTSTASPISTSFTSTVGANSVLVVNVFSRDNQAVETLPATLPWGTQNLTKAVSTNNAASTWAWSAIYYLFNPNAGTHTISISDTSPSGMVLQVFTLSGVDPNVAPTTYKTNFNGTTSLTLALPGQLTSGWAVVNSSYGTANLLMNVTATAGTVSCYETNVSISTDLGYVSGVPATGSTITANAGTGAGTQKMALDVAFFAQLGAGPAAPTGLTATQNGHEVDLSWNASAGATSYKVWRAAAGGVFTQLASGVSSTSYHDTAVSPYTHYTYYVQGVNGSGAGGFSVPASGFPYWATGVIGVEDGALNSGIVELTTGSSTTGIQPPTVSKTFTVSPGASVLVVPVYLQYTNTGPVTTDVSPATLSWGGQTLTKAIGQANTGAGSPPAACAIYYLFNPIPGTQTISCTDTSGLPVWILAIDAYTLDNVDPTIAPTALGGAKQYGSDTLNEVFSSTPFGAFVAVNAGSGGPGSITASSGTPSYAYFVNGSATTPQYSHQDVLMGGVLGLLSGSQTIFHHDTSSGVPDTLATAIFAPVIIGPSAPQTVTATGQANQIAVSWVDTSGGAATSYIVLRSTTSGSGYTEIVTNSGSGNVNYTDTSVTDYTTYYYVVEAVDSGGTSVQSPQASAYAYGFPQVPTGLSAVGYGTQVALSWSAALGGETYNVLRSATSGSGYIQIASGLTLPYYTDSGLTTGTPYYYVVQAVNELGTSGNSAQASATPQPLPALTGIIAVQDGSLATMATTNNSATISETFTVTPGASVLVVSLWDQNGQTTDLSPDSMMWRDQALTKMVGACAVNGQDVSALYYLVDPAPGTGVITVTDTSPGPVISMAMQVITLNNVDNTQLPWASGSEQNFGQPNVGVFDTFTSLPVGTFAVANSGSGFNVTNSQHLVATNSAGPTGTVISTNQYNLGGKDVVMGGVANMAADTVTVQATNVTPSGVDMTLVVAIFPPVMTGPSAPIDVVATGQQNQIALSWADSSGGQATNYIVLRSTTSGSGYVPIATNTGNASVTYTDANVNNYTVYYYVVEAVGLPLGAGLASAEASAYAVGAPGIPTGLAATAGDGAVTLTWTAEANTTSYHVLRSTTSGRGFTLIASPTTNSYADTTAANFTTYYYEVNAVNGLGTGGNSAQVSATPWARLTNYIGVFNTSADIANWNLPGGSAGGNAGFTNDAPVGDLSTGCLLYELTFAGNAWGGIENQSFNHLNETNATALEFDVKVEGPWDLNGQIQQLQPVLISEADGYMPWGGPTLYQANAATNNGWMHIVIPISAVDAGNPDNWRGFTGLNLDVYEGGWYPTPTEILVGYANIKFTGARGYPPVFSVLANPTAFVGASSATLTGQVTGGNGNYLANGTLITVTINGVPQTTTISDAAGDFSINYNTTGLALGSYPITYACASDYQIFVAGTNSTTSLSVVSVPSAPTILAPSLDATGTNLVVSMHSQNGYSYYLLSTTSLTPPVVWTTNSITAGTGGIISNPVPITPGVPALFLKYQVR
jgi:fibronectin type 3 domain-containing protein